MQSFDVSIIGAGVLGVSLAYHLAVKGHKVAVFEKEVSFATQASGKNAGMFRQLYRHPQLTDWASRSKQLWPEVARKTAFKQTGSIIKGPAAPAHQADLFTELSPRNIYCETDGLLDPHSLVSTLYSLSKSAGVKYFFSTQVLAAQRHENHWELQSSNAPSVSDWLVNASGAWINTIFENSHPELKVRATPFARYLFVTRGWQPDKPAGPDCGFYWDEEASWYYRQWGESERLVSVCDKIPAHPDTYQPSGSSKELLAQTLLEKLPEQAEHLSVARDWHCFRTYTLDELPIWGQDPRADKLFWLAAFGGYGMSTSFAAAYDAAKFISGDRQKVAQGFGPERTRVSGDVSFQRMKLPKKQTKV